MKNKVLVFAFFIGSVLPSFSQNYSSASNMILIRGGTFTMGSPATELWREKDEVQHNVTLSDFYMCKYEVSQKDYSDLMGNNPSTQKGENLPVETVSWYDAINYCNALSKKENLTPVYSVTGTNVVWNKTANGYRLPTEAEWEYACRAGTKTPFNTENSISINESNYWGHYPYNIENHYFTPQDLETQPGVYREKSVAVNSFSANKWGLFNMHGNVSEWCFDLYGKYPTNAQTNPDGALQGQFRVSRGGGWNAFAKHTRSAYRETSTPDDAIPQKGFRVVRNAK